MDTALASVLVASILGLSATVTTAIIKLKRLNGSNPKHRHVTLETDIATLTILSEERQKEILRRLAQIEKKVDSIKQ